jgi:hypothetical protein
MTGENAVPRVTPVLVIITLVLAVSIGPGTAQSGDGGGATSGPCGFGEYPPCNTQLWARMSCGLMQ